jgi:hypothetical protein
VTAEAIAELVLDGIHALQNGSASGVRRTLACPPNVVLNHSRRNTDDATRGTSLHAYCAAVLTGTTPSDAAQRVPEEHRETASKIDFRKLGADLENIRCESAFAINPRTLTARFLGNNIGREYGRFSITKDEIAGSSDIDGTDPYYSGRPTVIDLKFGWNRVEPAADNPQLKTYAAALAWISGADEVCGRICYVNPSGNVLVDEAVYDRFALDAFALELEAALDEIVIARRVLAGGGVPTVSPGDHCVNCPALDCCPAQVTLARAMVREVDALGGGLSDIELRARIESLSIDQAGAAMKKGRYLEDLLERVMKALRVRAMQEALPSSPGKEYHKVSFPKETFSQNRALAMLRMKGASEGEVATLWNTTIVDQVREGNIPSAKRRRKPT